MSTETTAGPLEALLGLLRVRVERAVAARRAVDVEPDDAFRGLYVSDVHADQLLTERPALGLALGDPEVQRRSDELATLAAGTRWAGLQHSFSLDRLDADLLLVALAVDLDPRYGQLFGYLHDDVGRRRATVGLALELCGLGPASGEARARLAPGGRLVESGLVHVEEPDAPVLGRPLRVPDRVTAHLLGDDTPHPVVAALSVEGAPCDLDGIEDLARALRAGVGLLYIREGIAATGMALAAAATERAERPAIVLDLGRLDPGTDPERVAAVAARESRLLSGVLIAGPVEALTGPPGAAGPRAFAEAAGVRILVGQQGWDPAWSRTVPLSITAPDPTPGQRVAMWSTALGDDRPAEVDLAVATSSFRLAPGQVVRATEEARLRATGRGDEVQLDDVHAGARAQNAVGLERLARRIVPRADWTDLVLPKHPREQLEELAARTLHREQVLVAWGMGRKSSAGRGVTGLFAGESGTGKTLAAEVLAHDLGLDLYVIDLSTVVDKYIGETEKNLDRIFSEADRVNGVLLFDEADALFGKRSEVSDARDRYANVEVAYLLQRMEAFDGVALLTTNLRANVDEAFTRRLDAIVDFPKPDIADRERLWTANLRPSLPRADDVDAAFLAKAFQLTGGEIRNVAVTSAYLAASQGRAVTMADVIRGVAREYRKLGRMTVASEFGPWFASLEG